MHFDSVTGWVRGVRHCPSPNFNLRPQGDAVSLLVIHNISLPPGQFGTGKVQAFFQNRLDPNEHPYFEEIRHLTVSAHFLIERDGAITQFVSCHDRAWHAGVSCFDGREACNDFSLGIELEGTDTEPYTDAQYTALAGLTRLLRAAFPAITPDPGPLRYRPGAQDRSRRGFRLVALPRWIDRFQGGNMTFLVLLLALALEKFSGWRRRIQRDGAWLAWLGLVEDLPSVSRRSWLGLLLAVVLPLLPLALLLTLLQPLAYGWLSLPLHLLVVVYSLGRGDVMADLGPFRDAWRREEAQAAFHVAERDLGILGGSESDLIGRVHGHLLWQGYQSFFAVIFWYALLGPVAALAYRLLALALEHARLPALREQAARVRHILDWLPVRALVLSFALVGNFLAVIRVLLHWLLAWDISAAALLGKAGRVASDVEAVELGAAGVASLDALWQLLVRAAVLWYAVFAFCALFL